MKLRGDLSTLFHFFQREHNTRSVKNTSEAGRMVLKLVLHKFLPRCCSFDSKMNELGEDLLMI
jgi:hypothetical protein